MNRYTDHTHRGTTAQTDVAIWVNGRFVSEHEPVISATDAGLLWGWGAFETLRVRAGKPVHAERHLRRLTQTCHEIHISAADAWLAELPYVSSQLAEGVGLSEATVRWTVTAGTVGRPTVICQIKPLPENLAARQQGISGISVPASRALANFKSTSYLPSLFARWAVDSAAPGLAYEPIFVDGAVLLEGATTNVVLLGNGTLWTPPLNGKILGGIMREVCLEAAARRGWTVCECDVTLSMVHSADGCYLTNSIMGAAPMVSLDGEKLGVVAWPFGEVLY